MKRSIGIIGCGTAGQAASIFLARSGHQVCVFEQSPTVGPIGAGLLVQPSGLSVLKRLGVAEELQTLASPINQLLGTTTTDRTILDLSYADLREDMYGLGLQRAAISSSLLTQMSVSNVKLCLGVEVKQIAESATLIDTEGATHGPFDLIIVADGARSRIRAQHPSLIRRDRGYRWGALWFIGDDPDGNYAGVLRQVYRGTNSMIGFLPSGKAETDSHERVSLFWSMKQADWQGTGKFGLDDWKRSVLSLAPIAEPLLAQIESAKQLIFAPYRDTILRRPYQGPVVFIGDAGHAMSPQLGQGVNLALLDAAALADELTTSRPIDESLRLFNQRRKRNNAFYQRASRWLTPFFQSDLTPAGFARDLLLGPMCKFAPTRNQMLLSLCGVKTGVCTAAPIPVNPSMRVSASDA